MTEPLSWEDLDLMVEGDPLELRDKAWAEISRLRSELSCCVEALSWASDYIAVPWPKPYRIEKFRDILKGQKPHD